MKKKNRFLLLIGLLIVVLLLIFSFLAPRPPNPAAPPPAENFSLKPNQPVTQHFVKSNPAETNAGAKVLTIPVLRPERMKLARKELVREDWNSSSNAFSYTPSQQSGAIGPNAVCYSKGTIYVLDNVGSRILGYDKDGKVISSTPIPTPSGQDLFPNPSGDGSLILVDRMENKLYKVDGGDVSLMGTADIRTNTAYGMRFDYDANNGELIIPPDSQDPQDTGRDIQDGKAVVRLKNGQWVALEFDKPVTSVEEVETDGKGDTWVFYQLEGDFQHGRIARIDPEGKVAGMSDIDTFYTFDTTRRLVATGDGIVVLGGDDKEGNLRSFDFAGMSPDGQQ